MIQTPTTEPAILATSTRKLDMGLAHLISGLMAVILGAGIGFVAAPIMVFGGLNWFMTEILHQANVISITGQGVAILMYGTMGGAIIGAVLAIVAGVLLTTLLVLGLQRLARTGKRVSAVSIGLLAGAVAGVGGGLAGGTLAAIFFAAV